MPTPGPSGLSTRLFDELDPVLGASSYELVDVEVEGSGAATVVRVLLDRTADHPLGRRIDLDGVADATRLIDAHLDAVDPIVEAFTLEVSSPGLERPLRTPAHFARYLDAEIAVKLLASATGAGGSGERRINGILEAADADPTGAITVDGKTIPYAAIERARTVFRWGEEEASSPTAPRTKSGKPVKKGALPKGQRPVHPKVLAALASQAPTSATSEPAAATSATNEKYITHQAADSSPSPHENSISADPSQDQH
jgi:ribosome maturation factor RimP